MTEYWYAEDTTGGTKSDNAWQEMLTVDFTLSGTTTVLIVARWEMQNEGGIGQSALARVQIDDSTTLCESSSEPYNASITQHYRGFGTFIITTLGAGAHFVDLDMRQEINQWMVYRNLRIAVVSLDGLTVNTDYDIAVSEGDTDVVDANTWYDAASLITNSGYSATYTLVLATGELNVNTGTGNAWLRVNHEDTTYYPVEQDNYEHTGEEGKDNTDQITMLWGTVASVGTSDTLDTQILAETSGKGSTRYNRIGIIDLSQLDSNISNQQTTTTTRSTTTSQWVDFDTLTFTPGSAGYYLILSGATIDSNSYLYSAQCRTNHTIGTSTGVLDRYALRPKEASQDCYSHISCVVKQLNAESQTFKIQYGYGEGGSGGTVGCKSGWIVAIRLADYGAGVVEKAFIDGISGTDAHTTPYREMSILDLINGIDALITPYREMGVSDAITGTDAPTTPFRAMGFADAGSGADVLSLLREIGFTDSVLGTDVFEYTSGIESKGFTDSVSAIDSFVVVYREVSTSDTLTGIDTFTIVYRDMSLSDSISIADTFQKSILGEIEDVIVFIDHSIITQIHTDMAPIPQIQITIDPLTQITNHMEDT